MDTVDQGKRSMIMARIKSAGNRSTELRFIALLKEQRITGWRRKYQLFGKPDFVFPDKKVAVFVDGWFWHGHPQKCRIPRTNRMYWQKKIARNKVRDVLVSKNLKQNGWKVVRIWEGSIQSPSILTKLRKALG